MTNFVVKGCIRIGTGDNRINIFRPSVCPKAGLEWILVG